MGSDVSQLRPVLTCPMGGVDTARLPARSADALLCTILPHISYVSSYLTISWVLFL